MTDPADIPDRAELARLGIRVAISGELAALRDTIYVSRNALAHLMEVTPDALRRWEEGSQGMNHASALRVGEWWWAAQRVLEYAAEQGIDLADWVHLSTASQYLALSADEIHDKCRTGDLRCEDLGVLGLYIHKSCIPRLNQPEEQQQ